MRYYYCCCCCCLRSCFNCNFYVKAEDNEEDVEFASDHMQCEEQNKLLVSANSSVLKTNMLPLQKNHCTLIY